MLVTGGNKVIKVLGDEFDKYLHINTVSLEEENHQLHCVLINSRSVGNKAAHIIELITGNDLDLLVMTETWLFGAEKARVSLIIPNGYTTYSKSRDSREGGGVAVICRNQFKCERLSTFRILST